MRVYYFVIILTLFFLASDQRLVISRDYEVKTLNKTITFKKLFLILVPMIFIFGVRSSVIDTAAYYNEFANLTTEFSTENLFEKARLYSLIQRFCKAYLFEAPELWLLTVELMAVIPFISTLSKYSINIGISIFVFFASTEFTFIVNGARQFIAVCIMFYAFRFILEEKPIKYYLCLLIASQFHLTVLVMLPAYFFARLKSWKKPMLFFLIVLAIVSFFSEGLFQAFDEAVIQDSVYAGYSQDLSSGAGVNILRVLISFVPVALAFYYRKQTDYSDMTLNACVNLSALNAAAFLFASTMGSNLTGRLTEYYNIFNLILYPYIFEKILPPNTKKSIKLIFIFAYLFFFYYQMEIAWGGLEYGSKFLRIYC